MQVPVSQIKLLINEHASRRAILDTFYNHLTTNSRIREGDAIFIFYAGNGSRMTAPEDWPRMDGMIETLCPYDERTTDENREEVYGIPDRTIDELLRNLAAKKGDNIVRVTTLLSYCFI